MPEPLPVLLLVPLPEPDVAPPLALPPIDPEPLPIEPDMPFDELEPDVVLDFLLFDLVLCDGDADVVGAFVVDEPFPVLDAEPELVCALAIAAVAANATATAVA